MYDCMFHNLRLSGSATPEDAMIDRIGAMYDILDGDDTGVITEKEAAAADVADAEPLFRALFRGQGEDGYSEEQEQLMNCDKKPIVGMTKEQFTEHMLKMRTLCAATPELFEFILKYLEKQVPASVGEAKKKEKSMSDPGSENFDLKTHLNKLLTRTHSTSDNITMCMKGFGFQTTKKEFKEETVLTTLCPCVGGPSDGAEDHMIFQGLDAVGRAGEMTLITGPPGSGKSTLLKALSCRFRKHAGDAGHMVGDVLYNGNAPNDQLEQLVNLILPFDEHLPLLSVGDTFKFISENTSPLDKGKMDTYVLKRSYLTMGLKCGFTSDQQEALWDTLSHQPQKSWPGIDWMDKDTLEAFNSDARNMADDSLEAWTETIASVENVVLRVLRLTHVRDTCVGNANVRGVSGGERRRVSIGEALLKKAPVLCCDEITNGLDANSALTVTNACRAACDELNNTTFATLLQPSPEIYDRFDRIIMMLGGKVVYSGKREQSCTVATKLTSHGDTIATEVGDVQDRVLAYFDSIGLAKPFFLPIPDFLDQVTGGPLQTQKFNEEWNAQHEQTWSDSHPLPPPSTTDDFAAAWQNSEFARQNLEEVDQVLSGKKLEFDESRIKAFQVPFCDNLKSTTARQWKYTLTDVQAMKQAIGQSVFLSILCGTLFLGLEETYEGGLSRAGLIFFITTNITFSTFAVLPDMISQRSVFYKHKRQGVVSTLAYVIAAVLAAVPVDTIKSVLFASVVYWLAGFQNDIGRFGYFVLMVWLLSFTMNQFTRMIASGAPNAPTAQALAPVLGIVFMSFSGYLLAKDDIPDWYIWIFWISPLRYAFEGLMINELKGLTYNCVAPGSCPFFTDGDTELEYYGYSTQESIKYFNLLVCLGFLLLFLTMTTFFFHFVRYDVGVTGGVKRPPTEEKKSQPKPQVLLDQHMPVALSFSGLTYDVPIPVDHGSGTRQLRLLQQCFGYFVPGTATCLMGSSGAGKTTLMDVIAGMKTGGSIGGDIWVNHESLLVEQKDGSMVPSPSFRRYVGYVEQSDIHLRTQTIREAFKFAADTRLPRTTQPPHEAEVTEEDREQMVEYTLDMLDLQNCADVQIKLLDSQQLKRCTMGVELVTDPAILFLDEPTSGLDSIGALVVMESIKKIVASGVTVVCTIHQPAETLFNYFDNLLLLKKGGYQIYFGPCPKRRLGSDTVHSLAFDYFQNLRDAPKWQSNNPADYILEFCDASKDFDVQYTGSTIGAKLYTWINGNDSSPPHKYFAKKALPIYASEYAIPDKRTQVSLLSKRALADFWRSPDYNATRMITAVATSLFLGTMYFRLADSAGGCQNRIAAIFLSLTVQITGMLQAMNPIFDQRAVHFRERQSKSYMESAYFIVIFGVEIPYILVSANIFMWIFFFMIDLNTEGSRVIYFFLLFLTYNLYSVAFGQFIAAMVPTPALGSVLAPAVTVLFVLVAGFMIVPSEIPSYWKWLYWISPVHYALEGFGANELHGRSCGGITGDVILDSLDLDFDNRWRNLIIILFYFILLRLGTYFALSNIEHVKR
eukprot:TRINITY_DN1974_c0_g1_i2.p1 TRINITY_DN1974_c0_g1~~TRINITY_DN1974_c0_g1_i2.p1  ORF type:complete len:1530 (+),score=346.04 TRINITY_DN1974_c0_g1_i2:54-4643(+)